MGCCDKAMLCNMQLCDGLWWSVMVYGDLRWSVMVYGGLW